MRVGSSLKRTNKTKLLEEELLILDVLFDSRDTFESLVKENYASWHNLPYSHNLETSFLREIIDKLINNDIIKSYPTGNKVFYALTETGGILWEAERAADWERYCIDSSTVEENGNGILSVESPSITTAQAFLVRARDCLLYKFNQDDFETTTLSERRISTVEWRTFPTVYSLSVETYPLPEINVVDWNQYESKRTWWRSLTELGKFQRL